MAVTVKLNIFYNSLSVSAICTQVALGIPHIRLVYLSATCVHVELTEKFYIFLQILSLSATYTQLVVYPAFEWYIFTLLV